MNRVVLDLTLFEADGVTPWFGSADVYGEVIESDFQTPDPDLPHDRPYLRPPQNYLATEINFLKGSSRIGAVSLPVLDKRLEANDQTTGIVTSRIKDAVGARAVWRRWDGYVWRKLWDGVVQSTSIDSDELLVYWFHLADGREREREQSLFFSNFVLFGADAEQGPAIDYAALPGGGFLIPGVAPYESIVAGTISHFLNQTITPGEGVQSGVAPISRTLHPNLGGLGYPVQDPDGHWYYRDVQVRWRPAGSSGGAWTTLRDMPIDIGLRGLASTNVISPLGQGFGSASEFWSTPVVYFASFDADDIPTTGQEIEFQILAANITPRTPFFWDGGSHGDLLREIYDGEHSPEGAPPIPYNEAAMDDFASATPATHFVLTEPVANMRAWVEENVYAATGYAPGFDEDQRVSPVSGDLPTDPDAVPVIPVESIEPVGDWEHGDGAEIINSVEFKYLRESIKPQEVTKQYKGRKFLFFGEAEYNTIVGTLTPWDRYFATEVTAGPFVDEASIAASGVKALRLAPVTVRAIGDVDGRAAGGDSADETGALLAARVAKTKLQQYARGAPIYQARALVTDSTVQDVRLGQVVRPQVPWLPSFGLGRRDPGHYMRVIAINDEDPTARVLTMVDLRIPDLEAGTGEEDCLTGGELVRLPNGRVGRMFTADGTLTNTCDHAVTLRGVLLIAGGGGGGTGAGGVGGGGGAGGVILTEDVEVAAGAAIPVHVGSGGALGFDGEGTVLWVDTDGTALDPDIDPPPAAYHALGGGAGGGPGDEGESGGSGGGGGAVFPTSGGGTHDGGAGTGGQGNSGGEGADSGGLATCQGAAGGGGGSYGGPGEPGDATQTEEQQPEGGLGGPATTLADWGVDAGGGGSGAAAVQDAGGDCSAFVHPGATGSGVGAGGGGGTGGGAGGIVIVEYPGAGGGGGIGSQLEPPTVSSTEVDDESGRVTVCVEDVDWPPVAQDGYRVRVDYAVAPTEPDAASGLWQTAGYLESPGCLTTPPVPTGAKVWTRAIAEADEFLPSEPSTPSDDDVAETPGLLAQELTISDAGVGTVTWEPNPFAGLVRIRGLIHDGTVNLDRPLDLIADVDAADGTYELPGTVNTEEFYTVDLEAWESAGPTGAGRVYRLTQEQPAAAVGGVALPSGAFLMGGPAGVPMAFPPGPEGWVPVIVDGVPAYVDPASFFGNLGGPVVRRILHLVLELSRNATAQSAIRNVYDQGDQSVVATAATGCTANTVYSAGLNAQGLRCQVPAGASGHSALVRGSHHEAPLKHLLNTGAGPVMVVNGQADWWMRVVDTVFLRLVTTGHASDILLHFGMGHITTFFTVGVLVGFEVRRTDTDLRAVVWSGVAGVSTYHEEVTLTGFSASEAHRLEVRIGYSNGPSYGGRYVEWFVDGFLAHRWLPPVGTDIVFTTEIPNDSTWSTWWSCYVANGANAAETWGLLGEGCIVEVLNNSDTIS